MLKKVGKFFILSGDVAYVGIGATIMYVGSKILKLSFENLEADLKDWFSKRGTSVLPFIFTSVGDLWDIITRNQNYILQYSGPYILVIIQSMIAAHYI